MREGDLTRKLVAHLRKELPKAVVLRHVDAVTAGVPDVSVTLCGRTTWLEVKHVNPHERHGAVQALMCQRLGKAGHCYYVYFYGDPRRNDLNCPARTAVLTADLRVCVDSCDGHSVELVRLFIERSYGKMR